MRGSGHAAALFYWPPQLAPFLLPLCPFPLCSSSHPHLPSNLSASYLPLSLQNEAGESCLHAAADGGSAEVLEALLSAGADPAVTEPAGGQTPLHYAAALGNAPAAMMLLSRGAPLDAVDSSGATAASLADEPEMREVFSTFLAERKAKAEGQAGSKKDEAGGAALQADV